MTERQNIITAVGIPILIVILWWLWSWVGGASLKDKTGASRTRLLRAAQVAFREPIRAMAAFKAQS